MWYVIMWLDVNALNLKYSDEDDASEPLKELLILPKCSY